MKRITIVSCVFPPEPIVSARTSADLAQDLFSMGNEIQVITAFPNRPVGKLYSGYKQKLFSREKHSSGYKILRCFSFLSPQSNLSSRFLENFSFGVISGLALLFSPKPDMVYANTWPIFAQGLLMLACKLRRVPLVLTIQDLYPESLVVQNRMQKSVSWYFKLLRWLDILIAKNCQSLIVISEHFKRFYMQDRGIQEGKIHVIPNWIDPDQITTDYQSLSIRQFHNIPKEAFLVIYGGNIGVAAGVDIAIRAFQHLLDKENIYLLIAGDGSMLPECRDLVEKNKLARVKFHNPWLAQETFAVLQTADLLVLPTRGEQAFVSVPSKLLSYMLSGRCILATASNNSEIAKVISSSGAGWIISPDDSDALARSINEISELPPEVRNKYGKAGHDFASQHFSKKTNLAKVVKLLGMETASK